MKISSLLRFLLEYVRRREIATISPSEVYARLGEAGFLVYDCNTSPQWKRGHIPGAIHVGLDAFPPDLLPQERSATLVFYCLKPT
jgi:rhodanese-related sulfurtransferase